MFVGGLVPLGSLHDNEKPSVAQGERVYISSSPVTTHPRPLSEPFRNSVMQAAPLLIACYLLIQTRNDIHVLALRNFRIYFCTDVLF
jgi:hypothetical protein